MFGPRSNMLVLRNQGVRTKRKAELAERRETRGEVGRQSIREGERTEEIPSSGLVRGQFNTGSTLVHLSVYTLGH